MSTVSSSTRPQVALTTAAASSAPTLPSGTLSKGDSGTPVKQLQSALVKLGYMTQAQMNSGPGTFGPQTEASLKKFQSAHKLTADGVYGPKTRAAMLKDLTPATPSKPPSSPSVTAPAAGLERGDNGAGVKQLQSALVKLGYMSQADMNSGPGVYGPKTEASVKKFQSAWKLGVDGEYGPKTKAALEKALAGQKPPSTNPTPTPGGPGKVTKPDMKWVPSANYGSRGGADIDAIVLHHTASNNVDGDLRALTKPNGDKSVSAHYLIGKDGTIYHLVDDKMAAWHAGVSSLHGDKSPSVNARSIGIEITNDGSGKTPFTEAQYRALEKLVPYLAKTYDVPMKNILGHRDVAPGRKVDPADNFDWGRIRRATDAVI
ncbi:peptidoglycan recognition protein family protein [Archangium violaceum]|uniref:peptidoglycan recognition protein family protein n=1 Tax=Archangium violaceum TaxID=83451 RepID=UPI0023B7F36A|nr:N-acetylmuramoyl-L-alanine amidase [Archangium violaceum]